MSFTLPLPDDPPLYRGDTIIFQVTISQGGSVFNLAGSEVWFTAKFSVNDTDDAATTIQKTIGEGIEVIDEANGIVRVTIDHDDTASLTSQQVYVCDIQVRDADGHIETVDKGTMTIVEDVTRDIL